MRLLSPHVNAGLRVLRAMALSSQLAARPKPFKARKDVQRALNESLGSNQALLFNMTRRFDLKHFALLASQEPGSASLRASLPTMSIEAASAAAKINAEDPEWQPQLNGFYGDVKSALQKAVGSPVDIALSFATGPLRGLRTHNEPGVIHHEDVQTKRGEMHASAAASAASAALLASDEDGDRPKDGRRRCVLCCQQCCAALSAASASTQAVLDATDEQPEENGLVVLLSLGLSDAFCTARCEATGKAETDIGVAEYDEQPPLLECNGRVGYKTRHFCGACKVTLCRDSRVCHGNRSCWDVWHSDKDLAKHPFEDVRVLPDGLRNVHKRSLALIATPRTAQKKSRKANARVTGFEDAKKLSFS
jgi:hypothetical protein